MQRQVFSKPVLIATVIASLILQACFPIQHNQEAVLGTTGFANKPEQAASPNRAIEFRSQTELATKAALPVDDLPRLTVTTLPEVEIRADGNSPRHRDRPSLSGTPQVVSTTHFRVHYTTTGTHQVPEADTNQNGIPDYVEEVAKALEYVWEIEINYFGWPVPPADNGLGGDDRYDVYLEDILGDNYAGYTEGAYDDSIIGDNPNTPNVIEERSSFSYIALDNDYQELEPSDGIKPLELMRITAAHEFLHAIQYGIDGLETLDWLWEATATWIEDEVFDGIDDGEYWLPTVFKSPDSCLVAEGGTDRVEDDGHWYGMWIFARFLSENYGHSIVQDLWYSAVNADGHQVIEDTLVNRNLVPKKVFEDFLIALLTRDFEEGATYPTVRLEGQAQLENTFSPIDGVDKLGADYLEVLGDGQLTIALLAEQLEGIVVGIANQQSAIFPMTEGSVSLDADEFEHLYLIVINHNQVSYEYNCQVVDYQVEVSASSQVQPAREVLPAPNFRRPRVEGLQNPSN